MPLAFFCQIPADLHLNTRPSYTYSSALSPFLLAILVILETTLRTKYHHGGHRPLALKRA
ncbi:hypothetical protein SBBP2_2170001 [Burkholderiales bacterium]|nr:hypothetical protein SBBP2_2170001 [Burkholderiales bacterium]